MTPPRIAVSGLRREVQGAERTGVNAGYVHAVRAAGALPVILSPLVGAEHAALALEGMDGLLLTGGEDLDPAWYGAVPSPRLGRVDRLRDRFELALFAAARQRGLPVLGICRGLQLVNVALGGTLWQDLPTERPTHVAHDPPAARDARTHAVRLAAGSAAAAAVGATALTVNSFHHQAVRDLAAGLRPTGWADDGVIEAFEGEDGAGWLLAVQWHPEEMHADPAAPDRGLFSALVEAAAAAPRA